jgi:DNA-binding NarL/FixJ family response regulator
LDTELPLEDIFREHGLSKREIEVARLMLTEGLDSEGIAKRLLRARITVKNHITAIYRKFGVKRRAEFMALFVKR